MIFILQDNVSETLKDLQKNGIEVKFKSPFPIMHCLCRSPPTDTYTCNKLGCCLTTSATTRTFLANPSHLMQSVVSFLSNLPLHSAGSFVWYQCINWSQTMQAEHINILYIQQSQHDSKIRTIFTERLVVRGLLHLPNKVVLLDFCLQKLDRKKFFCVCF